VKIVTLDFETDPFLYGRYPEPFVADIFDGEEHFTFWGTDCVARALMHLYDEKCYCYAHNGGKFDFHFMLKFLDPGQRVRIINGRIAAFTIGECEFRDSLNIIPVGLGKYKKDEIDYTLMEREVREQHKDEIISYLHTDTESLYDLVTSFVNDYGMHLTQAGAAMKYWRKMSKRKVPNSGPEYYAKFAPYYMGGRVECFEKGIINIPCEAYDINSAYPFAMIHNHPFGLAYYEMADISPDEVKEKIDIWKIGFFTIVAKSNGALPYRNEKTNSLSFPRDNEYIIYNVTGHEIKAALETDSIDIAQVLNVIIHDDTVTFDEYVYHFYQLRLKAKATGDKKLDIFCKIFLNALYGKFGANPENYKEYLVGDMSTLERTKEYGYNFAGTIGPNLLLSRETAEEMQRYYNVATAASITGFVRAHLWKSIAVSTRPLYCDTDCLFAGKVRIDEGKNLGQWGLEGKFDQAAIAGKKLYAFHNAGAGFDATDYKYASKGVRIPPSEIIRVAGGDEIIYKRDVPTYSYNDVPTFQSRKVKIT
jgi:hypothetical protein